MKKGRGSRSAGLRIAQSGRALLWWVASRAHLSIASSTGGQGRWEFAPVAHLLKDRQAARGSVAPLGAKGSPRLSMCQIASDSRGPGRTLVVGGRRHAQDPADRLDPGALALLINEHAR